MDSDIGLVKAPRLCDMVKEDTGYGFNLHGEKGVVGQYISAVDQGGPADRAGMCIGDRVIEVNGINVESLSHADVVANIRLTPDRTVLLVVDKITDNYLKNIGRPVTADLVGYSTVHEIKIEDSPNDLKNTISEVDIEVSKDVVDGESLAASELEEVSAEKTEDTIDSEREHGSDNSIGVEDQVATVTISDTEEITSDKTDEKPSDIFSTYDAVDPAIIDELKREEEVGNRKIEDKNKYTHEQPDDEPLPADLDAVPLSTRVRPTSVPKRKQVKQSKTDWKAKQNLFNNL